MSPSQIARYERLLSINDRLKEVYSKLDSDEISIEQASKILQEQKDLMAPMQLSMLACIKNKN